jgi:hypothetical protein
MSRESLVAFLRKVAEDEALRKQFTQFAAEHGFDLGELRDADLDAVAGAGKSTISSMDREGTIE